MPSSTKPKRPSLKAALALMRKTKGALTASRVGNSCILEPHRGGSVLPIGCYRVGPMEHARITQEEVRR